MVMNEYHRRPSASLLHWVIGAKRFERIRFRRFQGYPLSLHNPKTFNQKICYLKFALRSRMLPELACKVGVKEYVRDVIGDGFVPETLACFEAPDLIDINGLPEEFVAKPSHGSGHPLIITQGRQFSDAEMVRTIQSMLQRRVPAYKNQWWYGQIPARVIIERLLVGDDGAIPPDYKWFVFNGRAEFVQVDMDRFGNHTRNFYDRNWTRLPFTLKFDGGRDVPRPATLTRMIEISEELAGSINEEVEFVRVDLYSLDDRKVYVGEMTFSPGSGMERFTPRAADGVVGDYLRLLPRE